MNARTTFDMVLRLAAGETVSQADALRLLHIHTDRDELQRVERIARIKARDAALIEAAVVLGADGPGTWMLAGRLSQAVTRFESCLWPRLRAGMDGTQLPPSETAIHHAFLTGERVPKTQRRLYDLLTRSPGHFSDAAR